MGVLGLASSLTASLGSALEPAPYADWQEQPIKALSAQQIDDYLNGRGMGMALPAELNGYPGPRHVLDLADQLGLSTTQRASTQALFDEMRRGATVLGERIVDLEAALDELFSSGRATSAEVDQMALELGSLQGELRAHHLAYHIATRELLSSDQVAAYQRLRGYAPGSGTGEHRHGQHGGAGRPH